jgi:hypothetical protein
MTCAGFGRLREPYRDGIGSGGSAECVFAFYRALADAGLARRDLSDQTRRALAAIEAAIGSFPVYAAYVGSPEILNLTALADPRRKDPDPRAMLRSEIDRKGAFRILWRPAADSDGFRPSATASHGAAGECLVQIDRATEILPGTAGPPTGMRCLDQDDQTARGHLAVAMVALFHDVRSVIEQSCKVHVESAPGVGFDGAGLFLGFAIEGAAMPGAACVPQMA